MAKTAEITVPDIGGFTDVEIIEVLVAPGDSVAVEQSLITLESEKASMEVPSPQAGVVKALRVSKGDRVSEGSVILELEPSAESSAAAPAPSESAPSESAASPAAAGGDAEITTQVVVLGSGPGGYTAAFRAADLGKEVVLIERYPSIGGVCLNVGCIPSKALLHVAEVINEAAHFSDYGVDFGKPKIQLDALRGHKQGVIDKLTGGLAQLAKQRKVKVVTGVGRFVSPTQIEVEGDGGTQRIAFEQAIIAVGSRVTKLPFVPWDDERVMDSTDALELKQIPKRLLVVGGGIIGLEMATVYHALGSKVSVVELLPSIMAGADRDLVKTYEKAIKGRYEAIYTNTKVTEIKPTKKGLVCRFEGKSAPETDTFDALLVAVGRMPNGAGIAAEAAGVAVDEHGFIKVDKQQRTNVAHIYAIGDVVGGPMLAHKATHEGKVAAEVIAGMKTQFDAATIPSVAYTDPEVAWMGMTEEQAKEAGIEYEKGVFPWAASGRALSMGVANGMTKLLFDADKRIIGAGIVGRGAGDLIAEAVLALEMGADAADIGLTVHPHPTLSETVNFAAEAAEGTITDLYLPKRR
jgi:dihydrolipoamide dehydrogenase